MITAATFNFIKLSPIISVPACAMVVLLVQGCTGTTLHVSSTPSGAGVYLTNIMIQPICLGTTPLETKVYLGAPIGNLQVHDLGFVESQAIHIPLTGVLSRDFVLESYATAARREASSLPKDFINEASRAVAALQKILAADTQSAAAAREEGRTACHQFFKGHRQYSNSAIYSAIVEADALLGLGASSQNGLLAGEFLKPDALALEKKSLDELATVLASTL